ncbi:PH domain leucine-rich repeat-containing protein phosphatase 1-like [Tympanuchus pallidicinctus]|uniref:PH domain leucine-rich repeat-containing protein phosphatase 1-like n=1 Tax=Tympanuchus pallidicinctus TaxID=109042 RepID=UPI002287480C|nr:PH domain leucine-rich repeat-containing protein phosphatase 1-like [Tympanuchus pallidicinctus]
MTTSGFGTRYLRYQKHPNAAGGAGLRGAEVGSPSPEAAVQRSGNGGAASPCLPRAARRAPRGCNPSRAAGRGRRGARGTEHAPLSRRSSSSVKTALTRPRSLAAGRAAAVSRSAARAASRLPSPSSPPARRSTCPTCAVLFYWRTYEAEKSGMGTTGGTRSPGERNLA